MSLARAALRIVSAAAIYEKTVAGQNVFDSETGIIDRVEAGAVSADPLVAVYTDDSKLDVSDRQLLAHQGKTSLVFETAIQASAQSPDNEAVALIGPQTDAGMELTLDLLERQIRLALSDPTNTWAELFHRLAPHLHDITSLRASHAKTTRFAARQLTIEVTMLREPAPCEEPTGAWAELLAALDNSAEPLLVKHGQTFRSALTSGVPAEEWQAIAQRYSLDERSAEAFGLPDFELEEEEET